MSLDRLRKMLEPLKNNTGVLGIILMGSASLGAQDERSDVDLLVVHEGETEPDIEYPLAPWKWDVQLETLEQFKTIHKGHWSSHAFLTAKILLDETGLFPQVIQDIITIPVHERASRTEEFLDAYLNAFYRSMKSARRGNKLGTLIHANDSVRFLTGCLFIMNGLIPPYPDRISLTLDMLSTLPMTSGDFYDRLETITTGDPVRQSQLFKTVEVFFRNHGFGHIYDAWGVMLSDELID